jgi:hypothetical protein
MEKITQFPISILRKKLKLTLEANDNTIEAKALDLIMWWHNTQRVIDGYKIFLSEIKVTRNSIKESTRQLTSADHLYLKMNR